MNNICPNCGETIGQLCHCPDARQFLTLHDSQDYAETICSCVLERRTDGEGSNFLMCPIHEAAPSLLQAGKRIVELWDHGNLAGAVHNLQLLIERIEEPRL